MWALLSPKVLIALAVAGVLSFTHLTAYRSGKHVVQQEWESAIARSDSDARRLEQRRQDRANEAAKIAAARDARIRADAASARNESRGLRDDLNAAVHWAAQSRAAADEAIRVTTGLLGRCTQLYLGVAEEAQRADSEARELRQAWPR